ncbi:hypothetical protein F5887DRAFT_1070330 [Amanita rubescens]|nr:hypothetical protein F5887DRAFT_1070330 [Amanita rubescens]
MGRCVIVLTGGRSGGHNAAVLGAAFHPTKPLIATCGMDRAVKIWALPLTIESPQIVRQDKPLFSTTKIHRSRVLSINWLSDDILLSHDSPTVSRFPAVLRPSEEEKGVHTSEAGEVKGVYTPEAGEVMLWRWLSLNRFFPPELQTYQQTVRPSQGDWDESRSYQILFQKLVPCAEELSLLITPTLSMYTLHPHCPVSGRAIIMIYPESTLFHLLRVPDAFKHRLPPKYPFHHPSAEDTDTGSVPAGSTIGREALTASDGNSEGATIPGWLINIEENSIPKINACAMPHKGNIIIGVGTQGTLWTWTIK